MPTLRTQPNQRIDAAIEELAALPSGRGVIVVRFGPDQVKIAVGRQSWPAKVIVRDAVSLRDAQMLVETEARGSKIVVANQLSAEAKEFFNTSNEKHSTYRWSWLDRRGELALHHPDAAGLIHFEHSALSHRPQLPGGWRLAAPRSDGPIRGRAGISYAAALLLQRAEIPSIRTIAHEAQMSHGAIGQASKLLRESGLILPSGAPQIPELFWALAAVWSPTRITPVATIPNQDEAAHLLADLDHLDKPGWCLGGDEAAAAWGAPVFSAASRPWIWVPHEGDARRAERILKPTTWDHSVAIIAMPPTVIACTTRLVAPTLEQLPYLPTAHPLFLALELAQDPARGHEILDQWHPTQPEIQRVW